MRIALDVRIAQFPPYSYRGFGYVTKNLTKILLEKYRDRYEFYLLGYNGLDYDLGLPNNYKKLIYFPLVKGKSLFRFYKHIQFIEKRLVKKMLEKNKVDILLTFSTGDSDIRIPIGNYKIIMIFHDMIPWIFKNEYLKTEKSKKKYFTYLKNFRKADKIFTVSESSKNDLISTINLSKNKVFVAYNGTNYSQSKVSYNKNNIKKYDIKGKYILHIGGYDFRKNVKRIIEAYNKLDFKIKSAYKLVLAGNIPLFVKKELDLLVDRLKLNNNIVFTGFLDDNDLPSLYYHASIFVFPSLYEGFGLPIIDAMKYNCPIITSNNSSLSEIAQDVSILVNPLKTNEISDAIEKILTNNVFKNNIIKKASERVKIFTWENAALETIKIFNKL